MYEVNVQSYLCLDLDFHVNYRHGINLRVKMYEVTSCLEFMQ